MPDSDYSFTSRLLHRMALQSKAVAEMAFDADNAISTKKGTTFNDTPVFVTGLARSGTTMLMRYLYESGSFRSLTYLDMPFVLMPNLWKKLSSRTKGEVKERAHQDGIMVSFESPEAFEEVFWRVFTGHKYIGNDRLNVQTIGTATIEKFRDYVHNVLLSADDSRQERYLSKNNNNILRIGYLQKCFPDASIVIPFREPLQHAVSLLSQHIHFSKTQSSDKFSLDYMNWLGHYEFGLNQKPFHFDDNDTFRRLNIVDKMDLNFWLLSWKNYYEYAVTLDLPHTFFFGYEEFCSSPETVLNQLFDVLHIDTKPIGLKPFTPYAKNAFAYDEAILGECTAVYNSLLKKFNLWYTLV